MKVAKLVYISMLTRVIVEDDATEEQIIDAAKAKLIEKVWHELDENIEKIVDDEECPYDPVVELTPKELDTLKNRD